MKKKILLLAGIVVCTLSLALSNFLTPDLPPVPYNYANIPFPSDIINNQTEMDNMPASNPTTDHGATLGRVLFYDVDLSQNRTISCTSCHIQQFAFSDTARFSRGFNGALTTRNSTGLIHARFQKDSAFFWDNRAATLEIQTLMPIQSSVEMGLTLDTLVARLSTKPYYSQLFANAFGTPTVTSDRVSKALAQFIRSMNTFGSKFRQGVEITNGNPSTTPFSNFTAQENLGKSLFMDITRGNCQACHTRNIMVPQGSQNIGLDLVYADNGVGAASGNPRKNGQFSVPSLMNVALTPPYMHDGRFKTLEEVIDFYSDSIKPHPNLSGFLRTIIPGTIDPNNNQCDTCPPRRPHFSPAEKAALVAFLHTLTDTVITTDVRWSNPFTCGTHNAIRITACDQYTWNGTVYRSSGVYVRSYVNSGGCPSADTLHLTINTGTRQGIRISACGSYVWNGTTYTNSGTYVRNYTNSNGCNSTDTLYLTITPLATITSTPIVTQTLVSNECGARIYRYTASLVSGATGYAWTIPASVGGVPGVVVDSGNISSSRIIRLRYQSNAAARAGDSIKVRAFSSCATSVTKSYFLSTLLLSPPLAPSGITIEPVQLGICGERIYRFTAPLLPTGSSSIAPATGYIWSMPTGPVGSTGIIDSGSLSSRKIRIRFSSNNASGTTDSIRLQYFSACGNSLPKSAKLINTQLLAPLSPASISITLVSDVCGARVFRYTAPLLSIASAGRGAATGYLWRLPSGPVGSTGMLDSGTLASRVIRIRYSSNAGSTLADSIWVSFTSACGNSYPRAIRLTNAYKSGCPTSLAKNFADGTVEAASDWEFRLMDNPTANQFGILVQSKNPGPLQQWMQPFLLVVYDGAGRKRYNAVLNPGKIHRFGNELEAGYYVFIVQNGGYKKKSAGIKQR
jgi:cytochrome c peroxidase